MTELRSATDAEIVELATRLRELRWSWLTQDVPALAAEFGWSVRPSVEDCFRMDAGYGRGSGKIYGDDGRTEEIQLSVTTFATDDEAGREAIHDTFARMTAALTRAFGEPTSRHPGTSPQMRWAGPQTTLRLIAEQTQVDLHIVTNDWMHRTDKADELDRPGLL